MIAGGALGAIGSYMGAKKANEFNWSAYQAQQHWEQYLRSSAHTQEVQDLRTAGLNPVLSAGGGGASSHAISVPMQQDIVGPAFASGKGIAEGIGQAATMLLTRDNIKADTKVKDSQDMLNLATGSRQRIEAGRASQETENLKTEGKILKEQLQSAQSAAAAARTEEKIDESQFGQVLRWINRLSQSLQGSSSAVGTARDALGERGSWRRR